MQFNELINILRESKSLTREQLGGKTGLSSSAIDKFEKTGEGISYANKVKIAKLFNIDTDFINNRSAYPFGKNNFLKFYMLSKGIFPGFPGYEPLFALLELNSSLEIISLMPDLSGIKRLTQRSIFEEPAYAVVLRDSRNNIFLLRRKNEDAFIMWGGGLKSPLLRVFEMAKAEDRKINLSFSTKQLNSIQFNKIKNKWDSVRREDIEIHFKDINYTEIYEPDNSEISLLKKLRKESIYDLSDDEILYLKKIRSHNNIISPLEGILLLDKEIKRRIEST